MKKKAERRIEEAQNNDCAFFMRNPHRRFRLREALPGEALNPDHNVIVTTFVAFDGKSTEIAVHDLGMAVLPEDGEAIARWAWERADRHARADVGGALVLDADEIGAEQSRTLLPALPGLSAVEPVGIDPRRIDAAHAFAQHRSQRDKAHG